MAATLQESPDLFFLQVVSVYLTIVSVVVYIVVIQFPKIQVKYCGQLISKISIGSSMRNYK
jgi:hypothetical protein